MIFTNSDKKRLDLTSLNVEAVLEVVREMRHQNAQLCLVTHNMDKTMDAMAVELSRLNERLKSLEAKPPQKPTTPPKTQPANKSKK